MESASLGMINGAQGIAVPIVVDNLALMPIEVCLDAVDERITTLSLLYCLIHIEQGFIYGFAFRNRTYL